MEINGNEWQCDNANHNQGTFQRSSDCTMTSSHMEISHSNFRSNWDVLRIVFWTKK